MGQVKFCDICGTESPDKSGRWISNSWVALKVQKPRFWRSIGFDMKYELEICNPCWDRVEEQLFNRYGRRELSQEAPHGR